MNENIHYLETSVNVLNKQINHLNLKIVFDYDESFIDEEENETEIKSLILTLLEEDSNTVILEHEKIEEFEKFSDFKNYSVEFLNMIEIEIRERMNEDNTENALYSVIEYDLWTNKRSQNFLGVFSSKLDAVLSTQIHFGEIAIINSENENRINLRALSKDFYKESEFDIFEINQIKLNKIDN